MTRTVAEAAADLAADAQKILNTSDGKAIRVEWERQAEDELDEDEVEGRAAGILKRAGLFVVIHTGNVVVAPTVAAMLEWFAETPSSASAEAV